MSVLVLLAMLGVLAGGFGRYLRRRELLAALEAADDAAFTDWVHSMRATS